jgi:hypothetical protein
VARQVNKYALTLTGIYGAIQFVVTLFPMMISLPWIGGYVSLGLISAPVIGYLLGPRYGTLAVLLGSLVGVIFDPWAAVLGYFTPIAPAISALVAGIIRAKRFIMVPVLFSIAICLFLLSPIGRLSAGFVWFDIIALVLAGLMLVPTLSRKIKTGIGIPSPKIDSTAVFAVWMLVFMSVMADHVVFSAIGSYYYFWLPPTFVSNLFSSVILLYPIERVLVSVIGLFVALVSVKADLYLKDSTSPGYNEISQEITESTEQSL